MYEELVALTGIEPASWRSASAHFGVSSFVFGPVRSATSTCGSLWWPVVLPWCGPGVAATMFVVTGSDGVWA